MKTKSEILMMTVTLAIISFIIPVALWSFTMSGTSSSTMYPLMNGTIKGHVYLLGTNTSLPDVSLILLQDGSKILETKTDRNGFFELTGIAAGAYSATAEKAGYETFTRKTIHMGIEEAIEINIYLKPIVENQDKKTTETLPNSKMRELRSKHALTGHPASGVNIGGIGFVSYCEESYHNPSYNTESYDLIQENGFKDVVQNPLSTFSIDVDRASYSNIRRFLSNHTLPVKDAVRIEEMINYFDYSYPQPTGNEPFSVTMELGDCPWNKEHQLAMIGLKGKNLAGTEVPPNNLTFLLDVSGSMDMPNKLPLLVQAMKILVNNLRDEDRVAIVVYAGAAGCVLESTPGSDKTRILNALEELEAGGSTAGGAGIQLAYRIAKENFIPQGNNRVILATDGDFNVGASSDAEMTRLIEDKRNDGIFLTVLGFGMGNYKDSKMEKIADAGNGNYAYIDNILEAKKVFGEELWGTLYTIAKDVKIQVEFNPGKVKAYRLIGYENRLLNKEDFNDDRKDAGDIGAGHCVTALYELIPVDADESTGSVDPLEYQQTQIKASQNIMTLKLRYKDPNGVSSKLITKRVMEEDLRNTNPTEDFLFASAVAGFGMILRNSEHKGGLTYQQVGSMASSALGEDKYGYRRDFVKLVESASLLSERSPKASLE